MQALPAEIGQLSQLQKLHLDHNQLETLPAEIGQLSQLQELNLSNNELQTLPAEIGQLSQLHHLYLGDNRLQTLPAEIGQLSQLQELNLSNNKLEIVPDELGQLLGQLSCLKWLSLGSDDEEDDLAYQLSLQLTYLTIATDQRRYIKGNIIWDRDAATDWDWE